MSQTSDDVIAEIHDTIPKIANEVVAAFGTGHPAHPRLRMDIEGAYLIALASPTFRQAVRDSLDADMRKTSRDERPWPVDSRAHAPIGG